MINLSWEPRDDLHLWICNDGGLCLLQADYSGPVIRVRNFLRYAPHNSMNMKHLSIEYIPESVFDLNVDFFYDDEVYNLLQTFIQRWGMNMPQFNDCVMLTKDQENELMGYLAL